MSIWDEMKTGLHESEENAEETTDENQVMSDLLDEDGEGKVGGLGSDNSNDFLEWLSSQMEQTKDDDDAGDYDEEDMDADDFHNKAVSFSQLSKYKQAAALCEKGLTRFPYNLDLLADVIKYFSMDGNEEKAAEYYAILQDRIPMHRWNWRAFTFSVDYLLSGDVEKNQQEARRVVEAYKKVLPYEERAYMAESELEEALGNHDRSMEVLRNAISRLRNAAQSALRLADMEMKRGEYEKVLETTSYVQAASASPQPTINMPYIMLLNVMAEDAILWGREVVHERDVKALEKKYELLQSKFPRLLPYMEGMKIRCNMLKFIRTQD